MPGLFTKSVSKEHRSHLGEICNASQGYGVRLNRAVLGGMRGHAPRGAQTVCLPLVSKHCPLLVKFRRNQSEPHWSRTMTEKGRLG